MIINDQLTTYRTDQHPTLIVWVRFVLIVVAFVMMASTGVGDINHGGQYCVREGNSDGQDRRTLEVERLEEGRGREVGRWRGREARGG